MVHSVELKNILENASTKTPGSMDFDEFAQLIFQELGIRDPAKESDTQLVPI